MRRRIARLFVIGLALSTGCSTERKPGDLLAPANLGEIVVDATLIVGQPMSRLLLRKTLSPAEPYDRNAAAVPGADVRIVEGGSVEYQLVDRGNGRYEAEPPPFIQPNTEYRAISDNPSERRAVEDAFAKSVLWGFTAIAETNGRVLVDVMDFMPPQEAPRIAAMDAISSSI
jgi:hypothetical protein